MAKKPVRTFHPLQIAASLEAQNEAVGLLFAQIESSASLAERADLDAGQLKKLIAEIKTKADAARAKWWPGEV